MTIRRILLATDGSDHSLRAAEQVQSVFGTHGVEVTVLHVLQRLAVALPGLAAVGAGIPVLPDGPADEEQASLAEHGLNLTATVLGLEKHQVQTLMREGDPAEEIVRVAKEGRYDLIVLGSRGLSGWKGLLMGSVSKRVVSMAGCSVLVVK